MSKSMITGLGLEHYIVNEKISKSNMRTHLEIVHGVNLTDNLKLMNMSQLTCIHNVFKEALPCVYEVTYD